MHLSLFPRKIDKLCGDAAVVSDVTPGARGEGEGQVGAGGQESQIGMSFSTLRLKS